MENLIGKRFGRFTVLSRENEPRNGHYRCLCQCKCGTKKIVDAGHLKSGHTVSCGCKRIKHGMSRGITYSSWASMIGRCFSSTHAKYHAYGAKGIRVCDAWLSFTSFLHDMGERPNREYSIDRKNNKGHYEPGNCRWATRIQQRNNQGLDSRGRIRLTLNGETHNLRCWAEKTGIKQGTLARRYYAKWSHEDILTVPVNK